MSKASRDDSVWERNFAQDRALAERIASQLVPEIRIIRTERIQLEETWWRFFNMWNVVKDGYHGYLGRAQLYIPEVRKNVEAQARQLTKAAFPNMDCFDVSSGKTGTSRGAAAWKSCQQWAMDNCGLPMKYFVAMRQQCMLGTTPIYLPWRKETRREYRSRRDHKTKSILPTLQEIELFNGPDFIVRDLFRWYTFNPKVDDLSDGCFEIMAVPRFHLLRHAKVGDVEGLREIMEGKSDAYLEEEFNRDVMRAQSMGIQLQNGTASMGEFTLKKEEDTGDDKTFMRARIFRDIIMPEACESGEDPELPIPMQIDIYGNEICGLIKRNPFAHQRPPYVVGKYISPNADEFYGQGIPWSTQYMQYEMNAKAEQGLDSATMSLNPVTIVDPAMAGASNEFNIEPNAIWWADPRGVRLAAIPDTSEIANRAIMQLKSLMEDYSDRSPALPPQLLGKSRTATQSEMVFDSLGVDNWLFQLQNESRILTPMLEQWEAITDQNMTDDMLVTILGRQAGDLKRTLLSREDLLGRYAYKWKGASANQNKQVIARQMLDALKVFSMLPGGVIQNFNGNEFVKVLWSDLWQLPNAEKILGMPETMVSQDAEAENKMISMGLEIEVLPNDDDEGHMPIHDKGIEEAKTDTEKMLLMTHVLEHKKQSEQKKMAAQQQAKMQALQMQMAMAQGGGGGGGGTKKPGSGNRTQLSPNASGGDMASGVRA